MKIFKNKLFLISTLIFIMLLNLTLVAYANDNIFNIDINNQTGIVTIIGTTTSNTDVNIIIQSTRKRYYIDTTVSDSNGNYIFQTELPESITLECLVTIEGNTKTKEIIMPERKDDSGTPENPNPPGDTPQKQTVIISVDKFTIDKGYVIEPNKVELKQGDSIWDILKRILDKNNINCEYEYSSEYNSIYVQSIDGDGEFDHGNGSGWMYSVNGVYPDVGCSAYTPNDNDVIKWRYTTNLGADIGGSNSLGDDTKEQTDFSIDITSKLKGDKSIVKIDDNLISKIVKLAKNNGESIVTINIKDKLNTNKLQLDMTTTQLNEIKKLEDSELLIKSSLMEISIPRLVLEDLSNVKKNKVSICINKNNKIEKNKYETMYRDSDNVYNILLLVDNEEVEKISDKISIKIPYKLKDNKSKGNIVVYSLNSNGRPVEILGSRYNDAYDCAVFKTNSFKNFVVGIKGEYKPHKDIVKEEWYYSSVKYAVENKLFDGMPNGNFNPNKEMTRAMLVTVLYRLEGEPEINNKSNFNDVEKGEWYEKAVSWAENNNITAGYGNGLFGVNDNVTREQLATMLYRYAKLKKLDIGNKQLLTEFNDSELISSHHISAIKWAVKNNIISGKPGLLLAPNSNASRAEVAKIIMNYICNIYK